MQQEVGLFSEQMQAMYWASAAPSLQPSISQLELRENWTHHVNEFPEFYQALELILTEIRGSRPTEINEDQFKKLLKIICAMPFSLALTAIAFLDMEHLPSDGLGWCAKILLESANIYKNRPNDALYAEAKVMYQRIKMFSQTTILVGLLTQDTQLGEATHV